MPYTRRFDSSIRLLISFTLEELKAMESDEWEPTEKVLEFEKRHGIQRNGESAK